MKHESQKIFFEAKRDLSDEIRDSFKIMADLWEGITAFQEINNCVTVYGSARFKEGHMYYKLARAMGKTLAENGFTVMTGGGPGVMEAANRGAKEGGGTSLGCNIVLPFEQKPNPYVDKMVEFEFFFTRKTILRKNSLAYVLMPGGLGTMDEIFEVLTLIQTKKLPPRPIVCLGKNYWGKLSNFIRDTMIQEGTISEEDLNLLLMTDNTDEAIEYIKSHIIKKT
ncbi:MULTISPECIES: TIGR00730 family Rossman fold protein [Flavobacterium]|uniref:LOG family protein n=1 Tax=Flavobacterium TaxID=237 RepID=UPI001FCC01EF|nr:MULTISPECIES: TIGR00730 family Rossman fold protein [Flavobacterium]UOK42299.1 TIGR00730 family Rossman fold protein [Flavobacterium enshiense]